jgi:hypothetical protein
MQLLEKAIVCVFVLRKGLKILRPMRIDEALNLIERRNLNKLSKANVSSSTSFSLSIKYFCFSLFELHPKVRKKNQFLCVWCVYMCAH